MASPSMPVPGGGATPPLPFVPPPMNDQAALLRQPGGYGALGARTPPPDAYSQIASLQGAQQLLQDVRKLCEPGREQFEAGWWRTILYYFGRQWVWYDPNSRQWQDRRFAQWIPRPVTNKVREAYDSIASLMADIDLGVTGMPLGNNPTNQITADLISDLVPALATEHKMASHVLPVGDFFAILLGNTYLHPCWDKDDPVHVQTDRLWTCELCHQSSPGQAIRDAGQRCPSCGSSQLAPVFLPGTQTPQSIQTTIGGGKTIVASVLEMLLPLYAQSFDAVDRLIYQTWLPRHEIEDLAPETARKVNWATAPTSRSLQLYRAIGYQSDLPMNTLSTLSTSAPSLQSEGATIQYLWVRACKKYPQGVYLPFIGEGDMALPAFELVMQATSDQGTSAPGTNATRPIIPYTAKNDTPLWPWVHYPYKPVGGRLFAQGAVDTVLQKQDQINQNDSMTDLAVKRMGNPVWLEERGAQVERFTGMPGMVVKWTRVGANGGKPERLEGMAGATINANSVLRQQYLADFEEGTGTYDVVKGSKPAGVAAYSALQLLVERSQSRFNITFKARGEAYRQWAQLAFELERRYGPTERIRNVLGPNRRWTALIFKQADLNGNVQILVEDGTTTPKTSLGRRAALEHANQMGLLDITQPDQKYAALTLIGIPELVPGLDADVQSALQEQQLVEDWAAAGYQGPMPFRRMPWHDDATHFAEHRKWMNSDDARDILANAPNPDQLIAQWGAHLAEHETSMLQRMMAQSLATAKPGAPPPALQGRDGGGVGAGRALHDSNRQGSDGPPVDTGPGAS